MDERVVVSGGIGSTNTELSRYILDDSDLLFKIKKELEGKEIILTEEGMTYSEIAVGKVYDAKVISFVLNCLGQAMNKGMKLSNYKDKEFSRTALLMSDDFVINLWLNMKELNIDAIDIPVLGAMYRNYVDQAIRRPLNESDKGFLKGTHQETVQRVQQDITESQSKSGGVMGIFNRGR